MDNHYSNTFAASGFVASLALIGAASHWSQTAETPTGSLFNGSLQTAYEKRFEASNPLTSIATSSLSALKFGLFGQAADGAVVGRDGWFFTSEELEVHNNFYANIQGSAVEISNVVKGLSHHDILVLPVLVPDKAEIYADKLGFERPQQIKARKNTLTSALVDLDVAFLDATEALRAGRTDTHTFVPDDTHWSPAGSQKVAAAIAQNLSAETYAGSSVTTRSLNSQPFDGDLLAFVNTGLFREAIGLAQHKLAQYETTVESTADLFGDTSLDVALVGTSFSAKPQWHFEGFLKQSLQADVLNLSLEGQGPFEPMKAFLASDFLKSTPPKIVIWEIPVRYTSKEL